MDGMLGGIRSGVWGMVSEKDPRWNFKIHVAAMAITAGPPQEFEKKFKALKTKLGTPPKDLEEYAWKD